MTEDALDLAEAYIQRGEAAGLVYPSPAERASAKLSVAEQYRKEAKQGNIGPGAQAYEGGTVVGAGRASDHEAIAAEIEAERLKPATAQSMARRKKLRGELNEAVGDVTVQFTRD